MEAFKGDVDGVLGRAAREIRSMGREEFKNVISFALKHTEFMDSPLVGECLGGQGQDSAGTYNLRDLKTKGCVTIYLILPPHYLAQYDNNHCEEVTGLSSDGYRHQVIEDYTHDKMVETSAGETQSADYWNDSSNETTSASTNAEQSEQVDYWADNSASNENSSEQDNSLSNEASC